MFRAWWLTITFDPLDHMRMRMHMHIFNTYANMPDIHDRRRSSFFYRAKTPETTKEARNATARRVKRREDMSPRLLKAYQKKIKKDGKKRCSMS
jgi:hypothetical protein